MTVDPLQSAHGLTVELPTPCRTCRRSFMATICVGNDRHPASVRCDKCAAHRGYVSDISHRFIIELNLPRAESRHGARLQWRNNIGP